MLLKKNGFPEEDELVLCTVLDVYHHSVFVKLDEYDKKGLIHISEVSPGRIRNIRDYVVEGKKVVCKVLRVDKEKGHIDLSLRRVNESQKRNKSDEIKLEQKAEKIIESLAKEQKKEVNKLYYEIMDSISKKYSMLSAFFQDLIEKQISITEFKIEKSLASKLLKLVKEKIKPQEVEIKGTLSLQSYEADGVKIIKEALSKTEDAIKKNGSINYMGAGKYKIKVTAKEYKAAEKLLENAVEKGLKYIKEKKGIGEFSRD
ncbi:translation initiation factor IF-2 subunit alpha [Candidatus Woesearchaeota archaeon]|nr:translation initiation factor IF-2 subunit alpha [Candidatus Woesearchaeota archaeon]|tara:strand:+ start:6190 stop:6966 length:777 start_codon:yes stop_codon:yes gene_type:complete